MKSNGFQLVISFCFLVLLNACGIGHYHHLNLVRPDKNTTTALVKPKQKIKKVTETIKVDTAILVTTAESVLTKTVNKVSEKTENLAIALLKKPSQHAKKTKIGLKEKLVQSFFKTKNDFLKKTQKNELNVNSKKPVPLDPRGTFLYPIILGITILMAIIAMVLQPFLPRN
jgi:hypothetical protein